MNKFYNNIISSDEISNGIYKEDGNYIEDFVNNRYHSNFAHEEKYKFSNFKYFKSNFYPSNYEDFLEIKNINQSKFFNNFGRHNKNVKSYSSSSILDNQSHLIYQNLNEPNLNIHNCFNNDSLMKFNDNPFFTIIQNNYLDIKKKYLVYNHHKRSINYPNNRIHNLPNNISLKNSINNNDRKINYYNNIFLKENIYINDLNLYEGYNKEIKNIDVISNNDFISKLRDIFRQKPIEIIIEYSNSKNIRTYYTLCQGDLERLNEPNYLNDNIIIFYLK